MRTDAPTPADPALPAAAPAGSPLPAPPRPSPATGVPAAAGAPPNAGWSLRTQIHLIVATVLGLFIAALMWLQLEATRASVREEIVAGNRIAAQLLERTSWIVLRGGLPAMQGFLAQLGRVRANDITLVAPDGRELYHSPQPTYKQGRSAPAWFHALVAPELQRQAIELPGGGRLLIEADASRAILDGWDELTRLAALALLALAVVSAVVFWRVGRLVAPLAQVETALLRLERGDYATRLPSLPGREARMIGTAVNRLGEAIEATLAARVQALQAERDLAGSRHWAQEVEARLEAERREIAAALHDELGQSVTGIRSLARSLGARLPAGDEVGRQAAALIDQEAARLYDAMHGMIPRLTPLSLGALGLAEALTDLVASLRQRHPQIRFTSELAPDPAGAPLSQPVLLAAYRVAQEGLNNALKHSGAQQLRLRLAWRATASGAPAGALAEASAAPSSPAAPTACPAAAARCWLHLCVEDNGCGLPPEAERPARFGLVGLRERVLALGGEFGVQCLPEGGTRLEASLPV